MDFASSGLKDILDLRTRKALVSLAARDRDLGALFQQVPVMSSSRICSKLSKGKKLEQILKKQSYFYHYSQTTLDLATKKLDKNPDLAVALIILQLFSALFVDASRFSYTCMIKHLNMCLGAVTQNSQLPNYGRCMAFLVRCGNERSDDSRISSTDMLDTLYHMERNKNLVEVAPMLLVTALTRLASDNEYPTDRYMSMILSIVQNMGAFLSQHEDVMTKLFDEVARFALSFESNALKSLALWHINASSKVIIALPSGLRHICLSRKMMVEGPSGVVEPELVLDPPEFDWKMIQTESSFASGFRVFTVDVDPLSAVVKDQDTGEIPPQLASIADCLVYWNRPMIDCFIANFHQCLKELENDQRYFDYYAFLLYCLKNISKNDALDRWSEVILSNILFHGSVTIFGPVMASERLSMLRRAAVLVLRNFPMKYKELLLKYQRNPFLFVEMLTYAPDLCQLCSQECMIAISGICAILQKMDMVQHSDLLEKARSCCFAILCDTFVTSFDSYALFEYFMKFAYERAIQRTFLYVFRRSIYTKKDCQPSHLRQMLWFIDRSTKCGDSEFVWHMTHTTLMLIERRPYLLDECVSFFNLLSNVLNKFPSKEGLESAVKLLEYVTELNAHHMALLKRSVAQYGCPELYMDFLRILGRPVRQAAKSKGFLIRNPHVLPVFILVYGFERDVLQILKDCSENSIQNAIFMQDYGICEFLIDRIHGKTVAYRGVEFEVGLHDSGWAIEIIKTVCTYRMTFSVLTKLLQYHPRVLASIYARSKVIRGTIPLCSSEGCTYSQRLTLSSNCFQGSFSLCFWLFVDWGVVMSLQEAVPLFRIRDKSITFGLNLWNGALYAYLQTTKQRFEVVACDKLIQLQTWHHFAIVVHNTETPVTITSYLDGVSVSSSELVRVQFPSDDLMMDVGGGTERSRMVCAGICHLVFSRGVLEPQEITYLYHYRGSSRSLDGKLVHLLDERQHVLENIDMILDNSCLFRKLIKWLIGTSHHQRDHIILALLGESLSSECCCNGEYSCAPFLSYLQNRDIHADSALYDLVCDIWEKIHDEKEARIWLEEIVMNPKLWVNCCGFHSILLKWEVLVDNNRASFSNTNIFERVLDVINSIPEHVFSQYSKVLSLLPITESGVFSLVRFLSIDCHEDWRKQANLELVGLCAASIVKLGGVVWMVIGCVVGYLASLDVHIVVQTLEVIGMLANRNFSRLATVCLSTIPREVFTELVAYLKTSPGLSSLTFNFLSILSITTGLEISLESTKTFCQSEGIWYFFPLVLGFMRDDSTLWCILKILSRTLNDKEFQCVFVLYKVLSATIRNPGQSVLTQFFKAYSDSQGDSISKEELLECAMESIFFNVHPKDSGGAGTFATLRPDIDEFMNLLRTDSQGCFWVSWKDTGFRPDPEMVAFVQALHKGITRWADESVRCTAASVERILTKFKQQERPRLSKEDNDPSDKLKEFATFSRGMKNMFVKFFDRLSYTITIVSTGVRYDWTFLSYMMSSAAEDNAAKQQQLHLPPYDVEVMRKRYQYSQSVNRFYLLSMIRKCNKRPYLRSTYLETNCKWLKGKPIDIFLKVDGTALVLHAPSKTYAIQASEIERISCTNGEVTLMLKNGRCCFFKDVPQAVAKDVKALRIAADSENELLTLQKQWLQGAISTFEFLCSVSVLQDSNNRSIILPATVRFQLLPQDWRQYFTALPPLGGFAGKQHSTYLFVADSHEGTISPANRVNQSPTKDGHYVDVNREVSVAYYFIFDDIGRQETHELFLRRCSFVYNSRKMLQSDEESVKAWLMRKFKIQIHKGRPGSNTKLEINFPCSVALAVPNRARTSFLVYSQAEKVVHRGDVRIPVSGDEVCQLTHGFAIYSREKATLHVITSELNTVITGVRVEKPAAASLGSDILYLKTSFMVCKHRNNNSKVLYLSHAPVEGIYISDTHNLMVLTCADARVRIRSLRNGKKISTLILRDESVHTVLITHEFGFIVLITATRLLLLTSNGTFLKSVRYCFPATQWSHFVANGLDYLLFTSNSGIWYIEAFHIEQLHCFHKTIDHVAVTYHNPSQSFITISSSGRVTQRPFPLKSTPIDCS